MFATPASRAASRSAGVISRGFGGAGRYACGTTSRGSLPVHNDDTMNASPSARDHSAACRASAAAVSSRAVRRWGSRPATAARA